ncbi:MAG: MraZ protein [Candidatus Binatia bacterium]|jgi:MraZ protein
MFRGTFFHALDEKARVAIPRKFREALIGSQGDTRVVITKSATRGARALDIYPIAEWQNLEARIRERPQFQSNIQQFKRKYIAPAQDLALDAQGRIVVPANLREWIDLGKEAVFTGDLEKFLLWSKNEYERVADDDGAGDDELSFEDLQI